MSIDHLTSDMLLIDIEHHFRISAGPGAGKTYWLVEHIKNVLNRSERLAKNRKIACITYTNIAVETILSRLGTSAGQVEVSTIHSFLYKHIIKPYISFIADEYNLNISKMDGHDEHIVRFKKVKDWIENHPNRHFLKHPYSIKQLTALDGNKKALSNWLASLNYKFDSQGVLKIESSRGNAFHWDNSRKYLNKSCLDLLEVGLLDYKKLYWKEGTLHHDDVLLFSHEIIKKYPFILKVLHVKFPYFFIDEFQDTNPIQTSILEKIGKNNTIIGVIGDKAQSIYGFQGAEPEQFSSFYLPNIVNYQMAENRRSTNQIIDLLNSIRDDIKQEKYKDENGEIPVIIVGEINKAYERAKYLCNEDTIYSLSRDNITSNVMKREIEVDIPDKDLFLSLYDTDSNGDRRNLIIACIKATELAREGKFKDAIKDLERIFREKNDKGSGKMAALNCLQILLKSYDRFKNNSLYEFYLIIKLEIKKDISDLRTGNIKSFYEEHNYQELALCVKILDDISKHRTIHKAKGDEFDNVFLILKKENDFDFILRPNLINNEEHRINYVAVSRAVKRLFISLPSLEENKKKYLKDRFQVEILNIV